MNTPRLPGYFFKLFKWFCKKEIYEELQGDLEEAFIENAQTKGLKRARRIYQREVFLMVRPSVVKFSNLIPTNMSRLPKNYLKTSIRATKLNPFYVLTNVVGLAMAISISTIGYFNYRFNVTFNDYYENANNLFKVHAEREGLSSVAISTVPLAPTLREAGIESFRYDRKNVPIRIDKKLFQEQVAFIDQGFARHFTVRNLKNQLINELQPNEIVISKETALKLFDQPYPVGEFVEVIFPNKKEKSFQIKDVFEKPPTNVSFVHSILMPWDNLEEYYGVSNDDWASWIDATFVAANRDEKARVESILAGYLDVQNQSNQELLVEKFRLDDIKAWPACSEELYGGSYFRSHLHKSSVAGIAGSAIAILLLACFNFINTSIALSGKRLKEIAVRKILGGTRKSTITQFVIENTFLILLAVLLSFFFSYMLIPAYNAMFRRELIQMDEIPIFDILSFAVVLIFVIGTLAASYPSVYISNFAPLKIFRNKVVLGGKNRLMAVLLTFQFALCFYNVFGLFLLVDNAHYQKHLDRGYEPNQVINIPIERPEQFQLLKDRLLNEPNVNFVAGAQSLIGFSSTEQFLTHQGTESPVATIAVGADYAEALQLRLKSGSFFSPTSTTQELNEVVVNQMLVTQLGEDILNKPIKVGDQTYKVIGIVDDFNLKSITLNNKITPTVIKYATEDQFRYASVSVKNSPEEANYQLEKYWYELFPQELYVGFLQKEVLVNVSEINRIMILINVFIGVIVVLIAVLGLYTLISLTVQRRSKEFGVRKVLGASQNVIIHLLGKELYLMVLIAGAVGLTMGMLVLTTVFDIIYPYHLEPTVAHYVKAIISVLLIIFIAVGYKIFQTGRLNPVQQLRME